MNGHRATLLLALARSPVALVGQATPFTPGMVVTNSSRIRPGRYYAPAGDSAAIIVHGSNIVLDLRGVELIGDTDRTRPDRFPGVAIRIDGGSRITVRGVRARGYKIGIVARRVTRLALLDNDLSYNRRPRLYSGIEKESLIDWLDYHDNEHDEWLRYGTGIYLADVTGGEIRGNIVQQGMDGLMVARSHGLRIVNNTFSFNSGVGVGLYRASRNVIMNNRVDFNVRGYSDGFYYRGQDSAGLLIYEQSDSNVVAFNSITHSGDGLFLWAGQHTMDTGLGGANDNLFYRNDFSFAPTNGMEATFSRNAFVANRIDGSWHGLWGGYSFESTILGNHFSHNQEAIAIEHGQDNRIAGNVFDGDTTAVHLWAAPVEPSDWGYPRHRDTRSRDYDIIGNTFRDNRTALRIDNTLRARITGNAMDSVGTVVRLSGDTSGWSFTAASRAVPVPIPARFRVNPLPGGMATVVPKRIPVGRAAILVGEWGPYDWRSPRLWPVGRDDATPLKLRIVGPPGRWNVIGRDGITALSRDGGRMGDTIAITPAAGRDGDFALDLEYRGAAVVTPFGVEYPAGAAVPFGWRRFVPAADWHLKFVAWDSTTAPLGDREAISRALGGPGVATLDTTRLDLTWYGPPIKAIPQSHVLTGATATLHLAPGKYMIRTISDDAIRVYVNDALILDDWNPGESHVKEVEFRATGSDRFRVEHVQLDGWYELRLDILPAAAEGADR
ncbi:MAG: NosD domain-containing protein [Gemmatimonadales bacterium]